MVNHFMTVVNRPISFSYTITNKDIDHPQLEPMLDRLYLIMKYSLRPYIQFQIAVPSPGGKSYIPFNRYADVVLLMEKWSSILDKNGIGFGLDCHSLPKCALPHGHKLEHLYIFKCENFMIDIGPDLDVWPCFPLSDQIVKLDGFETFSQIREYFSARLSGQAVYDGSCDKCDDQEKKNCDAGCLGFRKVRQP